MKDTQSPMKTSVIKRAPEGGSVMLIQSKEPLFLLKASHSPEDGLRISILFNYTGKSAEDMTYEEIDNQDYHVNTDLDHIIGHIIHDEEKISDYSKEDLQEFKEFINDILPEKAIDWIINNRKSISGLEEWTNFLSLGDKEARAQALHEFPTLSKYLMYMENTMEAIDSRKEILPYLSKDISEMIPNSLGVFFERHAKGDSTSVAKKIMSIESMARNHIQENGPFKDFYVARLESLVRACALTREDQIPKNITSVAHMCNFYGETINHSKATSLSVDPYLRVAKGLKNDEWGIAYARLKNERYDSRRLVRDYICDVSSKIFGAVWVDIVRKSIDPEIMHEISQISEKLWSKQDISDNEGKLISCFMDLYSNNFQSAGYRYFFNFPSDISKDIIKVLCSRSSLKRIGELQERWHHTTNTIQMKSMKDTGLITWSPVLGKVPLGEGLFAREITSNIELEEQGRLQKNCIGGHHKKILSGSRKKMNAVFSIEDEEGNILSSVDMECRIHENRKLAHSEASWSVAEHKAIRNSEPSERAHTAVSDLKKILSDLPVRDVQKYADSICANTSRIIDRLQIATSMISMNPCNPDIPDIVLEAIQPVLPKSLRGLSLEDWKQEISKSEDQKLQSALSLITSNASRISEELKEIHQYTLQDERFEL